MSEKFSTFIAGVTALQAPFLSTDRIPVVRGSATYELSAFATSGFLNTYLLTIPAASYQLDSRGVPDCFVGVYKDVGSQTTLILPATSANRLLYLKDAKGDADINPITLSGTIDGYSNFVLSVPYQSMTLIGTDTGWWIV